MEAFGNLACALQTWCPLDLSKGEDAPGARVLRGGGAGQEPRPPSLLYSCFLALPPGLRGRPRRCLGFDRVAVRWPELTF